MRRSPSQAFWSGRRVTLTGHTGFKGAWMLAWLERLGAKVTGIALPPEVHRALFSDLAPWASDCRTIDIRDAAALESALAAADPEILIHMAAQSLVRRSYQDPLATAETNIQGTVNLLDCARRSGGLKAVLVVTTDKVYANDETARPFRESDPLGGHDPYSASKAAAEIMTQSYRLSFLGPLGIRVATARAGNVIGGGDFAEDRLIPDVIRAHESARPLHLRYPRSTRPWQHVLDCLAGYLLYAEDLYADRPVPDALNFGPDTEAAPVTVGDMVSAFSKSFGAAIPVSYDPNPAHKEMAALALDNALARQALAWAPRWDAPTAIARTAEWYRSYLAGTPARALVETDLTAWETAA